MLCENCNERQATIHITKIINGKKKEMHLCDQCTSLEQIGKNIFDYTNFITNLTEDIAGSNKKAVKDEDLTCDHCGMTYEFFKKHGKFGCEHCYDAFEPMIAPMIKRMHGKNVHTGKMIKNGNEDLVRKREIEDLDRQLKIAVEKEEYEEAAILRDKIKELAKGVNSKG
ncbi:UvrB/UvrC motif-containing protein [Alkalibacter mobilis]|uniref:UvrB/UvrC motif-containing protein n=1 Tax=Alkalibacter mobilis TaxID=2787712 RepID=UPI00189CE920|nr:UvrB/UvrC motif-containing protein [Alkalibacter mobilis]MBF7096417.1 UvrB/UvrC motif-containing protein [Alkalibacter mobilis]